MFARDVSHSGLPGELVPPDVIRKARVAEVMLGLIVGTWITYGQMSLVHTAPVLSVMDGERIPPRHQTLP